jgi:hypothetical protein
LKRFDAKVLIYKLCEIVPAFFRDPVHNQSVVVGEKATIECPVEGDNPIKVTWLRNEKALPSDEASFKVTKISAK